MSLVAAMAISLLGCDYDSSYFFVQDNSSDTSDNAKANDEGLRVAWWGSQERHNITIEALDIYSDKQDIPLTYEYSSWSDYFDTLSSEVVGNNMPDVLQMSISDIITYQQNGSLADLSPYIKDGTIDTTYADRESLESINYNAHIYGYPSGITSVSVIYVKDYFDKAGIEYPFDDWTWDEYIEIAEKIYKKTGIPSDIPFLIEARWLFDSWIHSYGYSLFSDDGKSMPWTKDQELINNMTSALYDIKKGIREGYFINPEEGMNWVDADDNPISSGKIAMSFILSNQYSMYSSTFGNPLGLVSLPILNGASENGMYLTTNLYWCISSECKNKKEAARLINYLVNDINASVILGTDRGVSINSNIRNNLIAKTIDQPNISNSIHYINHVHEKVSDVISVDPVQSTEILGILKKNYAAFAFEEMTPEECINDFIERATKILEEY